MEKVIRILVVDDAHFVRELIKQAIKKKPDDEFEYKIVKEAETGKEAIIDYFKEQPDFIILDLSLPDINGFDVMKQILSKDPNAKIIAMSDNYSDSMREKTIANGATYYVPKPFQNAFLWNGMDAIIERLREEGHQFPYESSEKELFPEVVQNELKKSSDVVVMDGEDEEDELFKKISHPTNPTSETVIVLNGEKDDVNKEKSETIVISLLDKKEEKDSIESYHDIRSANHDNKIKENQYEIISLEQDKKEYNEEIKKDTHNIKQNKKILSDNDIKDAYYIEDIETPEEEVLNLDEESAKKSQTPLEPIDELKQKNNSYNEVSNDNGESSQKTFSIRPPRDKALKQMYEEQYQAYPSFYEAGDSQNEKKEEDNKKKKKGLFSSLKKIFKKD
ncbi:response regulator transcription factor [Bacillus sp. NPDC094106]|uniref:response regulator transcription factor n=1 Tax=Bacillus sp. NPDC094106 TaxID=3363949 RepID=UPI0038015ADB